MNFIPDTPKNKTNVPYFDDVTSADGWQGFTTGKSIERLKGEIAEAVSRLGGTVLNFQQGKFQEGQVRDGFRLNYFVDAADGRMVKGRIDIAALPVKDDWRIRKSIDKRKEQSLRMALYMLKIALDGTWFLQQLSPGYSALMPFMLADGEKTISQIWGESSVMSNMLLPPPDGEFIEGSYQAT